MNVRALLWILVCLFGCAFSSVAETAKPPVKAEPPPRGAFQPTRKLIYKKVGAVELRLDVFEPKDFKSTDRRAAFVAIHGGGWGAGNPRSMHRVAAHCADLGMVGFSVQYRLFKAGSEVSVFECVKDARSALRYVRAHAAELGIDPQKIVASGSSAGGHLAVATALFDEVNEAGEDTAISCVPNALVLFSPVIDTSTTGYGNAKVGERWRELSPAHRVGKGTPPTLLFHGTADATTPFKGAQLFHEAMLREGNRCDLVAVEGAPHTYMFKDAALYAETVTKLDGFLASLGFVKVAAAPPQTLRLPGIISDHMVVQAGKPAVIWGWASPGEPVVVSFAGQSMSTQADAKGAWRVTLDPLTAGGPPQTLTVKGKTTLTVKDVLIGEVWLASGQSNMAMQIKGKLHGSVENADAEIAAATDSEIRMFLPDETYAIYELPVPPGEPQSDRAGSWRVCSPQTVADFSAMGYFFARDLRKELKVPVGIVAVAVGGTPIEAWTARSAQEAVPELKPVLEDWRKRLENYDAAREQQAFLDAKAAWLKTRSAAVKSGEPPPKAPAPFKNLGVMMPGGLFNGLIAPLAPYTIRGCIWYQGERNAQGPFSGKYGLQLRTLIQDWRARWADEFYFAWVQLPRFQKAQSLPSEPKGWGVLVRDEMRKTLSVPKTGMAITIDLGGEKDGHPTNKVDYARRLSRVVLHDVYDQPIEQWSGPLFRSAKREGDKMVIQFDHSRGLKASSETLKGFAIAGADQKFVWAQVEIVDDTVQVRGEGIAEPVAVRYAWAANPACNLVNGAGLPASPFRTDDWP